MFSQPTVSHHLKKLREAGLLASERRGTWVYYKVVPSELAPLAEMLSLTKHQNIPRPDCCHYAGGRRIGRPGMGRPGR